MALKLIHDELRPRQLRGQLCLFMEELRSSSLLVLKGGFALIISHGDRERQVPPFRHSLASPMGRKKERERRRDDNRSGTSIFLRQNKRGHTLACHGGVSQTSAIWPGEGERASRFFPLVFFFSGHTERPTIHWLS